MPRNPQGLYTLPAGNPVISGTTIESVWANTTLDDVAAALTASLPRNGSAPMTGPLILANSTPQGAKEATSKAYVDQFMAFASGMPVGGVIAYAAMGIPPGFLECNGQAVSRVTWATLFAAVGVMYGPGDASTTFNVPDMRDQFIRGVSPTRPIGTTQTSQFGTHNHGISDPGHIHGLTDNGHAHGASQESHGHVINDPGHAHTVEGSNSTPGAGEFGNASAARTLAVKSSGSALTGVTTALSQPPVTVGVAGALLAVNGAITGLTLGVAGGDETRPQNIAQIYIIKAVQDSTGPATLTGITTSDAQMISVDNTLANSPVLDIHSNVAFGTVKLDSNAKIPQNLVKISTFQYIGPWDASGGQTPSQALPSEVFSNGDLYQISVGGTLQLRNAAGTPTSTVVVSTDQIVFITASTVGLPEGWYFQPTTAVSGVTAGAVGFTPTGTVGATNVQAAIVEVAAEAAPLAHVGAGGTQHATAVAAGAAGFMTGADKTKLDSVATGAQVNTVGSVNAQTGAVVLTAADVGALTQAGADALYVNVAGDTMIGQLKGITPVAASDLTRKDYVDGTQLLNSSAGWKKFPGGLIVQWGSGITTPGSGNLAITFPIPFPNACTSVQPQAEGTTMAGIGVFNKIPNSCDLTAFQTSTGAGIGIGVSWIAIGF